MKIPPEQIIKLYRFADKVEEVNWNACCRPDRDFIKKLIPLIHEFTLKTIKKVTREENSLKAAIGISGGLDSSVTAKLTADAMLEAVKNKKVKNASLVLLAFKGISEEDFKYASKFAKELLSEYSEYKNIRLNYQERDLTKLLNSINLYTDEIVADSRNPKVYSGELATRLINCMALEYANKTGHCLMEATNGTEIVFGETVIGAGGECAPLADLYKSQVYKLAELIKIPKFVIVRPPINSAFGNDKIKSYFKKIPANLTPQDIYKIIDPILYLIFEKNLNPKLLHKKPDTP